MHMADALISPVVGGIMWGASTGTIGYATKKIKVNLEEKKIPLMGVMGAFVFAAQMLNVTIPLTGSSGHIGGGMLLAILLGPYAGFLTMVSVLAIQALLFADGGLLALGCNIINLGFFTCFVAYPFIYRPIIKKGLSNKRLITASVLSAVAGLQMGALGVVLETVLSGKTELPFTQFLLLMQPIHLAIGIIEGILTATVIAYIYKERPVLLGGAVDGADNLKASFKKVTVVLLAAALILGGFFSNYASELPDGLEWSVEKITGSGELEAQGSLHAVVSAVQEKTSLLPDYDFKTDLGGGTSFSGVVGGMVTLIVVVAFAMLLKMYKRLRKYSQRT